MAVGLACAAVLLVRAPGAAAQDCVLPELPPTQATLSSDQRAITDLIERFRLASFVADTASSDEVHADSSARSHIMAPDYLRLEWQRGAAASPTVAVNEGVADLVYEGVHVATFDSTAVATYRSHYLFSSGWDTWLREVRVFNRQAGRWRMVSGIGFPLCGWSPAS